MSTQTYRKKPTAAGLLAQVVTIAALFVFWRLGQKWVVVPGVLLLTFLIFFLPKVIRKKEQAFHKKALALLAGGKAAEVVHLARGEVLLSLFGAQAPIDAKLGLACMQMGDFLSATAHLAGALPMAPPTDRPVLLAAYAKALFVIGRLRDAAVHAAQLVKDGGVRLPETLVVLARSQLALGVKGDQLRALLTEAHAMANSPDVAAMAQLAIIELHLAQGRKPADQPDLSNVTQRFVLVWGQWVKGRLLEHRHKQDEARVAYAKAVALGKEEQCFFADLAHERLDRMDEIRTGRSVATATKPVGEKQDNLPVANRLEMAQRKQRRRRR